MLRVVLVAIICGTLPLLCRAQEVGCIDAEFPPIGTGINVNEYRSYSLQIFPDPGGDVCSAALSCTLGLSPAHSRSLAGRSWFLTDNKDTGGIFYPPNYLQLFRVTCPDQTLLHMTVLRLDLPCTGDFIEVDSPELGTQRLCGRLNDSTVQDSTLVNNGFGNILGPNATVQFRSDDDGFRGMGFVLVATCIHPKQSQRAACVDTGDTLRWDPEFFEVLDDIPPPSLVPAIHKRSAALLEERKELIKTVRVKKFAARFEQIELGPNDTVTFVVIRRGVSSVVVEFGNGTTLTFDGIWCLYTDNDLIMTRIFTETPPNSFSGPGMLEIFGDIAFLEYSVNDLNGLFLPNRDESEFINTINNYIWDNWIFPYPIIDQGQDNGVDPFQFPFPPIDPEDRDLRFRQLDQLGWYRAEPISPPIPSPTCPRVLRSRSAPAAGTKIDVGIFEFCAFFLNSCTPALRAACRDLLRLDF